MDNFPSPEHLMLSSIGNTSVKGSGGVGGLRVQTAALLVGCQNEDSIRGAHTRKFSSRCFWVMGLPDTFISFSVLILMFLIWNMTYFDNRRAILVIFQKRVTTKTREHTKRIK